MTFQDVDTTTGAGTLALLAWSTNWGRTWALDTARSSFNDYELDIEYNFGADSIYVLLTNNLTTTDENLRLRWSALSNLGSSVAFKQFNPATTADHDRLGTVAVNRQTNEMAVMYTKFIGANQDVRLSHAPTGFGVAAAWTLDQTIGGLAGNESRAMIDCHQRQGAYRICYVSSGGSFDTVIYMSTFTLPNFAGRQVVNQTNITAVAPSVVGAGTGAAFNGGVLFATNNALMYDGSAVLTSVEPEGNNIPGAFSLEQNYPNPFNPSTVIKFSVPTNGYVSLKVYDIMGREVASIVNGELKAGVYNADFNASMLSSGVYFYKLTSGSFSETKKMMLIK
jgi:hypothetical protein